MEAHLHRNQGRDYADPLLPADLHGEDEETRSSTMKKVKDKVHKLKDTIKHGHNHEDHKDEAQTSKLNNQTNMNDSPVVRSGLAEPTVMGTPVLAEDLYATHSDILDPPVRSFARWEDEERPGSPPPLSTGYETHLTHQPHEYHTYGQDVNTGQLEGSIGKTSPEYTGSYGTHLIDQALVGDRGYGDRDVNIEQGMTGVEKGTQPAMTDSPGNLQSEVTGSTMDTGEKDVGITEVLKSFHKLNVHGEPDTTSSASDQNEKEPNLYTGSHDQFAPQPVDQSPPLDTIASNPSNPNSSYSQRISSATSAITDKASAVKDSIVSRLSPSGEKKTRSSFPTDFSHKVADTLSGTLGPVYEKVTDAGSSVMSKMPQGPGGEESPATKTPVAVREYLADRFKPGDDDKELSEVITNALHMGKRQQPTITQETSTITYVMKDEGERRLQDSSN
ncbi:hypothetical protein SSX86_017072 [Deinandra increscens subsp. villosa]|uniref:Low-temperature-induced 65 kDa protein-like n=1 Tax=Deinandra increscens subsp. villosa TaxID=3103831 RepID=A0AAP0CZF5_9ASTR